MPVAFEGPADEVSGLAMFLEEQRAALLRNLDGLTDEPATSHPTASDFCMLTLVKHVAFTERRWIQLEIARREVEGLLIEEVARHAAHADLIRESIDGSKGS